MTSTTSDFAAKEGLQVSSGTFAMRDFFVQILFGGN